MNSILINRKTKTLHFGKGNVPRCNARVTFRRVATVPASESEIAAALPDQFCKKCFKNGEPA